MSKRKKKRGLDSLKIDKFSQERKTLDTALAKLKEEFDSKSWMKPRQFSRLEYLRSEAESIMEQYKLIEDDKIGEVGSLIEDIVKREAVSKLHNEWLEDRRKRKKEKIQIICAACLIGLISLTGLYVFGKNRHDFVEDLEDTYQIAEEAYHSGDFHTAKRLNQKVLNEIGLVAWGKEKKIKKDTLILKEDIDQSWNLAFWYDLINGILLPYNQMNSFYGYFIPNPLASGILSVTTLIGPVAYGAFRIRKKKNSLD